MARELAKNPTVLVVNNIVFAHGGLLPHHLKYGLQVRLGGGGGSARDGMLPLVHRCRAGHLAVFVSGPPPVPAMPALPALSHPCSACPCPFHPRPAHQ